MSRPKGTTLLELCFVLTIAGTLATVAIPPISRAIDQLGLIAAAEQVRSGLHTARIWSIIHNRDCRLRVASRVTYVIECQTPEWLTIDHLKVGRELIFKLLPAGLEAPFEDVLHIKLWETGQVFDVPVVRRGN